MSSDSNPHSRLELQTCACHLVQRPLTVKEHDPEIFRLIRRHEAELDRLFTQRLGYRLHVTADTARLYKDGFVSGRGRALAMPNGRAFHPREYVLLALVLGATVAGPGVMSLRDLVERVRSAAVESGITIEDSASTRRALVAVLQWMIGLGLAQELYERIEAYAGDDTADAVLRLRPDRIALLPFPVVASARGLGDLLERAGARLATRQWMRCRLVEEPVLYRSDLTDAQWSELRRRLGEEQALLEEMFGLELEARAEGVAAIDPAGNLTDRRFPTGGTVSHAALLFIAGLHDSSPPVLDWDEIVARLHVLAEGNSRRWSAELVEAPERLAREVTELLLELRLAEWGPAEGAAGAAARDDDLASDEGPRERPVLRLLPAAGRFLPAASTAPSFGEDDQRQESLW